MMLSRLIFCVVLFCSSFALAEGKMIIHQQGEGLSPEEAAKLDQMQEAMFDSLNEVVLPNGENAKDFLCGKDPKWATENGVTCGAGGAPKK